MNETEIRQAKVKAMLWSKAKEPQNADEIIKFLMKQFDPIDMKFNLALLAGDWHGRYRDKELVNHMYSVAKEYSVNTIFIPGDFWDCYDYTHFTKISQDTRFREEISTARTELERLTETFDNIFFCRGNHEKRFIKENSGMLGIKELFALSGITKGYRVTLDDYMYLTSAGQRWRISHPELYSPTPLTIARGLARKYHCNHFVGHGHRFNYGFDDSGQYQLMDGGGMFDSDKLEYMRNTTTHPSIMSGFGMVVDGRMVLFPGKGIRTDFE